MKEILFIWLVMVIHGCGVNKDTPKTEQQQKYIYVDAKVRFRNSDGTNSYNAYKPFKTRTIDLLPGYSPSKQPVKKSKYGGWLEKQENATGFFHVKRIGDRWWCIDPEGNRYVNIGLSSIHMGRSEKNKEALRSKYQTREIWIMKTIGLLQKNGFNCAGSWSDYEAIIEANKVINNPFAYTVNWNFMSNYGKVRGGTYQLPGNTGYPSNAIFVFDPEFETFCDHHARQLESLKDDPNLFGHFSDNELPFHFNSLDNFLDLPEKEPGHKAALEWLKEQRITRELITDKHRKEFLCLVADKYFSIVSKAIIKYDPNHMYIGSRFYREEKNQPAFMKVAGKYLDIVSINYYHKWTPEMNDLKNWSTWAKKPFIITEYYIKGEDSGMPNKSGAGWIVRTQKDRGLFYQNYNLALLESKNCVGWHYFKYQDNDTTATGVDPSNIDANKGIVNNDYEVWMDMMEKMYELNTQVYNLIEFFDKK